MRSGVGQGEGKPSIMKLQFYFALGLLITAVELTASSLPDLVLPQTVGVNIHFTRGHERDLDLIAEAGFRVVRMDFGWAGTERHKGEFDWSAYDELTAGLEKRGLLPYYILDYSNPLYEETVISRNPIDGREQKSLASPQHPESVAAFARWAAAAVDHFREHAIIWEIWNEPNISFWKPKPNVEQYIALVRATTAAMRRMKADAIIVAPATSEVPVPFLETFFKSGALAWIDAVSVHPYRNYSKPPETAAEDYGKLRDLIARHAPPGKASIPILSGEWGYATHQRGVSLETQAAFLVRQQLANLMEGIPVSIWYDWKNDGPDPKEREHNFGTVTQDLLAKPAYEALQVMAKELNGYRVDRRLKTDSPRDYVLWMHRENHPPKLAGWTLDDSHDIALKWSHPTKGELSGMSGTGRKLTVTITEGNCALPLASLPAYFQATADAVSFP